VKRKNYPPLNSWMIAGLISVIAVGLLAFPQLFGLGDPTEAWIRHRMFAFFENMDGLVKEEGPKADTAFRVLVFGSSLTQAGVEQDVFFEERFQSEGRDISFYKTFFRGGSNEVLWTPAFYQAVERLEPDLICLEDQIFAFHPRAHHKLHYPAWIRNYSHGLDLIRRRLVAKMEFSPILEDKNQGFDQFLKHQKATALVDTTNFSLPPRTVRPYDSNELLNQHLTKWTNQGVDIVVYHLPRPAPIEKGFLDPQQRATYEELMSVYQRLHGVEYWPAGDSYPFAYYFDDRHLNEQGRSVFSNWLVQQIDARIASQAD
jgi:hypothetical protein